MSIKDRTIEYINSINISVKQFEEKCSLSNGYVSSMRKGYGIEKLDNVLSVFPELNREWLLYGEGEMIKEVQEDAEKCTENPYETIKELIQIIKTRDENVTTLLRTNEMLVESLKQMKKAHAPLEGNAADADVS